MKLVSLLTVPADDTAVPFEPLTAKTLATFADDVQEYEELFYAKESKTTIYKRLRLLGGFTPEQITAYSGKIKRSLIEWDEVTDYPPATPIAP